MGRGGRIVPEYSFTGDGEPKEVRSMGAIDTSAGPDFARGPSRPRAHAGWQRGARAVATFVSARAGHACATRQRHALWEEP
jgi:hypothetical protein